MKFQVALPGNNHLPGTADWILQLQAPDYQDLAATVDDLGFDILSTSEHIVMPDWEVPRLGPYWTHALTVMAFIAGATRRIRVDATVLVMPYHHPVELAKAMATLDVLSGGRVNLSVGVGHAEQEFQVLGAPFAKRGRWTDEALEVMKLCWAEPMPVFHGEFFDIEGVAFEPRPLQQPRPPIWIGGNSQAALRRAARHDGWQPNPVTMSAAEVPAALDYIRSQPEFAQRRRRDRPNRCEQHALEHRRSLPFSPAPKPQQGNKVLHRRRAGKRHHPGPLALALQRDPQLLLRRGGHYRLVGFDHIHPRARFSQLVRDYIPSHLGPYQQNALPFHRAPQRLHHRLGHVLLGYYADGHALFQQGFLRGRTDGRCVEMSEVSLCDL